MKSEHKTKQPLFHIAKRDAVPPLKAWGIRIAAIILALILSGILTMIMTKLNPIDVYASMIDGVFGTTRKFWSTLQSLAMLLLVALAVTPAFKMKFWNIGAEGQVLAGGLATAACMIYFGDSLPTPVLLLVMILGKCTCRCSMGSYPCFLQSEIQHQ